MDYRSICCTKDKYTRGVCIMILCYCRKSRISETDELDRQVRLVKGYCKAKQYTIDKVFAEVGSSIDPDRPEYTKLLNLLNKYKNCTIVVTDLDRLSRNTVILGLFQQLCKQQSHLVELTNGTIYNYSDYTDSFTSDIIASVSAYIYQQTKAKMYRGMIQARKEGKRIGAKPFGYDIVNKRLAVNPVQADTVKRVFKLIADGVATAEVVRLLKQDNVTTNTGRFFDTRAIRLLIKNEGYTGKKNDNVYPPIISKELFLLANSQLKSLQNCGNKRSYALSNKIVCSKCGSHLILGIKKDRDAVIVNSCNSSNSIRGIHSKCDCMGSRLDLVESLVISDCKAYIENRLAVMYDLLKSNEEILQEHKQELDAIQSEIDANSHKLQKLNDLYLLDNITAEDLKEKSSAVKDTIALLNLKRERVEGFSLYDRVQQIQNDIVALEELQESNNINDLVVLVDSVQYYKDTAGISVNTKFKE